MKEINYTFSIGSNCDSTFFIREYDLCKISGPFDWVYIDFASAIANIKEKFIRFTSDIFYYSDENNYDFQDEETWGSYVFNSKYLDTVDSRLRTIGKKEFTLHHEKPFKTPFFIKQHYLPLKLDNNLVQWNRSCWFPHHNFQDPIQINVLENKIMAFNQLYEGDKDKILFLGFNKFENLNNAYKYIKECVHEYHSSNLGCNVFYIILAPTDSAPEVHNYNGITIFLTNYEANKMYQFEFDSKFPEINQYLRTIYNFNPLSKPSEIEYLPSPKFSEKNLDIIKW